MLLDPPPSLSAPFPPLYNGKRSIQAIMLLRAVRPPFSLTATAMAGALLRAAAASLSSLQHPPRPSATLNPRAVHFGASSLKRSSLLGRGTEGLFSGGDARAYARVSASQRGYRKVRRQPVRKSKEKELELSVSICIEDDLPDDPEILVIVHQSCDSELLWSRGIVPKGLFSLI